MKNTRLAVTVLAAAVALIGCGDKKPPAKAEKDAKGAPSAAAPAASGAEVKIGHVGPLTGGIAHLGKDNENGRAWRSKKRTRPRSRSTARK